MAVGTVVLLPSADPRFAAVHAEILATAGHVHTVTPSDGPDATRAARICAVLNADPPDGPMTIVAIADAALLLPSIALAQRAAHRTVLEYVLVDPDLPPVSDAWPDAPVTVIADGDQRLARLRGWEVRTNIGPMVRPDAGGT